MTSILNTWKPYITYIYIYNDIWLIIIYTHIIYIHNIYIQYIVPFLRPPRSCRLWAQVLGCARCIFCLPRSGRWPDVSGGPTSSEVLVKSGGFFHGFLIKNWMSTFKNRELYIYIIYIYIAAIAVKLTYWVEITHFNISFPWTMFDYRRMTCSQNPIPNHVPKMVVYKCLIRRWLLHGS